MKIEIRKDAVSLYISQFTDWDGFYNGKDIWERIFEKIAGTVLEVDTSMLFKHEFNVKPIPGVTSNMIRITEEYVEQVIDDQRIGKALCEFCESISESTEICTVCGRKDYLEPLSDE